MPATTDPLSACRAELLSRLRDHLEHIIEAAHNPDCIGCGEVCRLAHEGFAAPPSSLDDWQT